MAIAFKVGDEVEMINTCSGCIKGRRYILVESGSNLCADAGDGEGCTCENYWKLVNNESKNIMSSILTKFQTAFLPEPEKTFRQAGITKDDGSLTTEGQGVFLVYLLKKNGVDFKKEVVDVLLADEKK